MKRFGYLQDRLFLISFAVYAFNRLVLKSHLGWLRDTSFNFVWSFSHSHFDDLLLIPVALPVMLWVQRLAGLRKNDFLPGWSEMVLHLLVWSVMCKLMGPLWLHIGTPDPLDLVAYAVGGVAACVWWNRPAKKTVPSGHEF